MSKFFSGSTPDQSVILGAWFWNAGVSIEGVVSGSFTARADIGPCVKISLTKAVTIPGERMRPTQVGPAQVKEVAVGGLKGLASAIAEIKELEGLMDGDAVKITCTGEIETGQPSPMLTFSVDVKRK